MSRKSSIPTPDLKRAKDNTTRSARSRPAKRVNGAGSVYQRKDGKWVAAVSLDGRRVVKYAATRLEAESKLHALLDGQDAGTLAPPCDLTLDQWVQQWLSLVEGDLRPTSRHTYRSVLAIVTAEIGSCRLDKLTPLVLSAAFASLQRQGRGPRRLALAHTVLKTCLAAAVDMDLIRANPLARVKKPRWQPKERQYWTVEQTQAFLRLALGGRSKWGPLLALLVTTGLRVSEALGLDWSDVDLEAGTLQVRQPRVLVEKEWHVQAPKTKAGRRTVSLPAAAITALRMVGPGTGPVFLTVTGKPPRPDHLRHPLERLCRAAGVPRLTPHGLRHVAAMLALEATRDPYLVQRRLGHSHISVTLGIYGYSARDETAVADGLDRLLQAG